MLKYSLFFSLLISPMTWAQARFSVEKFQSKLFTENDKTQLKEYFSDDYLVKKRSDEFAQGGKQFFHFLSGTMAAEIREERKKDPFYEVAWPDPINMMELYLLDYEKKEAE